MSLIFWSLIIVISIRKYARSCIMRADNHGEGGILAAARWSASAASKRSEMARGHSPNQRSCRMTTLLYGDGTITPTIIRP